MTAPIAVHVTPDAVRCVLSGVVTSVPAVLAEHDGVVLHGTAAVGANGSVAVDILARVDDSTLEITGDTTVPLHAALSGLVSDVLRCAGARTGEHDVVLTHPPHWGPVRRDVLVLAARPHARDTTVVSSAVVARDAAHSYRPCSCGGHRCRVLVVDRTRLRTTVSTVVSDETVIEVVDCVLAEPAVGADAKEVVALTRGAVRDALAAMPACRIVVHGTGDLVTVADIDSMGDIPVIVVDDDSMAAAVLPGVTAAAVLPGVTAAAVLPGVTAAAVLPGVGPAVSVGSAIGEGADRAPDIDPVRDTDPLRCGVDSPARSGAWLADRAAAVAAERRGDRRRSILVGGLAAACAVVGLAAALLVVGGDPPTVERSSATMVTAAVPRENTTDRTTFPSVTVTASTTTDAAGQPFSVAGVSIVVPPGWHVEPGPERVELRPDRATDMRILLVVRELAANVGVAEVEATLAGAVSAAPGRLSALEHRADIAARPTLGYLENASDGTTVGWTVVVSRGEQISIGCQASDSSTTAAASACSAVLGSLEIEG